MSEQSRPDHLVEVDFDPFAGAPISSVIPTTEAQREVWLADQLDRQASLAFNESVTLALRGAVDADALERALVALLERHDVLRGALSADGSELVIQESIPFGLPLTDLSDLTSQQADERMLTLLNGEVSVPFDLINGPLIRARLIKVTQSEFALVLTAHHIVCDGFSFGVLLNDLAPLYRAALTGTDAELPPADSFADYAARLASQSDTETEQDAQYWVEQYRQNIPVLDLPTVNARPAARSFASARLDVPLAPEAVRDIRKLAADSKTGVFAVLLTAFSALLARLSRTDELVVGVPSAGQSVVGSTSLVGHCVNLLPMRVGLELTQSVRHNLSRTQETVFGAFDHQRYTYGSLLKKLPIKRDPSRPTLVSVMFNLDQALDGATLDFGGPQAELVSNPRAAENFELFLNIAQTRERMVLECQYNTDLFDESTIRHWLNGLKAMLQQMCESPDQPLGILDILGERQAQMLKRLNQTDAPVPDWRNLGEWLSASARQYVELVALRAQRPSGELESLSFAALDSLSNQIAHTLRARGIGRGDHIGICLPRSKHLVIAQWAALKSGAAYVPLDPAYPEQRLAMMADDAGLALILTDSTTPVARRLGVDKLLIIDDQASENDGQTTRALPHDDRAARPEDPAYLIYTSGSTGTPKGVRVPHRSVINFLTSMTAEPGLDTHDRLLAVTTLSFDIAVLELLLPPVNGAQIVLASTESSRDGAALAGLIGAANITVMQATPSTWRLLFESGFKGSATLKALVGGEPLPPDLAATMLRRCRSVWNLYGPTETTVWSSLWRVARPGNGVRIGRPIANTQIHVLDERAQPCPIGVPGEIVIGGAGVTLGYHNRPLLNTEKFMADPFSEAPGARLYRTGDLGRWTSAGELEHLGRIDNQVKVRGFRIELGEIEACLATHPAIATAVAGTKERRSGDVRLIAWVVAKPDAANVRTASGADKPILVDAEDLREHLRQHLPDYMLPQHVVWTDRIPLLANGKVDRSALTLPEEDGTPGERLVEPRNPTERAVVDTMQALLDLPSLGINDDFFTMGGHSLLAARLVAQLSARFETAIPMRIVFESPTAAQLSARIDTLMTSATPTAQSVPLERHPEQSFGPLSPMQQRIRFVEQMMPGRPLYNVPSAHRLTGAMNLTRFRQAIELVVNRQPSLRTIVSERDGEVMQIVRDQVPVSMPVTDLSDVPRDRQEARLQRALNALIAVPFDIEKGPLFTCAMFRLAPDEHVFFFMAHHIIWDGWSFDVLYEELAHVYGLLGTEAGQTEADLRPPLPASYIDFVHWQQQFLDSEVGRAEIDFWMKRIAAQPRPERLPGDFPRSNARTGAGATVWINVSEGLAQRLRDLASQTGTTLNMVLLAAYALLISDLATDKQVVVGMPLRGRPRPEFEPVMGFFNNLLPLHLQPQLDWSFTEWLGHVRRESIELLAHQDVPFERLASEMAGPNPLDYQVLFSFQDARGRNEQWGGLEHHNVQVFQRGATEDIGMWLLDGRDGLTGGLTYNSDLFTRTTAEALRRRFSNLLKTIAKYPELTILRIVPRMHGNNGPWATQGGAATTPAGQTLAGPIASSALPPSSRGHRSKRVRADGDANGHDPQAGTDPIDRNTPGIAARVVRPATRAASARPAADEQARIDFDPVDSDEDTIIVADSVVREPSARSARPAKPMTDPSLAGQVPDRSDRRPDLDDDDPLANWTPAEKQLVAIWSQVLDTDDIDLSDNFFDLGGTSLQAMQVIERLERLNGFRANPRLMVFGSLRQLALSYLGDVDERKVMTTTLESIDPGEDDPDAGFGINDPAHNPAPRQGSKPPRKGFFARLFNIGK